MLLGFVLMACIRLFPYDETAYDLIKGSDDWNLYARNALDIKYHGVLIPSQTGAYAGPGGFLYNYFVAFVFLFSGNQLWLVYLMQVIMLGASVILIHASFGKKLLPFSGFVFFLCLCLFAYLDVYVHYSFRLLSENLAIFFVAFFVYSLTRLMEKGAWSWGILTALSLALTIATRPNLFPVAAVFIIVLWVYKLKSKQMGYIFFFSLISVSGMAPLVIRNYLTCGEWNILPLDGVSDSLAQLRGASITYFAKKIAFCFGYLSALESAYRIRPHWMLMWWGFFLWMYFVLRSRIQTDWRDKLLVIFLLCFYLFSVVFVLVGSYGFRTFLPVTFIVLAFSIMGIEHVVVSFTKKNQHA